MPVEDVVARVLPGHKIGELRIREGSQTICIEYLRGSAAVA